MSDAIPVPASVRDRGSVLVTGAGGFLGANLVWALREHGFAVRALVRRRPEGPQWTGLDGVEFVTGDVRDPAQVDRAVRGVAYVIHAAALTDPDPRPRAEAFRVNVEGTRHVCRAALREGVRRLVLTSSASTVARGTREAPADEETPYNLGAISAPYYESKRQAEAVVAEFGARGLEAVTLCPAFVIGPRDARPTTNQLLLYAARSPWPVFPPGGINVVDVREAALAHVRALWMGQPGRRYLLAGPYQTYLELGILARRIAGWKRSPGRVPSWAHGPGSLAIGLASRLLPRMPAGLSLPNFQYGFVAFHVTGARADQTFHLTHRPVGQSVYDTLAWFQGSGLAPWLSQSLRPLDDGDSPDAPGADREPGTAVS